MPSHNEQYRLHETLRIYGEAMSRRFGEDFEIIVIVNGSTDGMVARLP